jgi:hypothetical protein
MASVVSQLESSLSESTDAVRAAWWPYLALVLLLAVPYLGMFVFRGWIPHDEGTQAQCAERVLHGEMPHRDFDDPYTGGLAYFHALCFRLLGTNLAATRIVCFGFAILFTAATFSLLARALPPWAAVAAALTCVGWSLPNYFSALPSWYILFFSTFGVWSLLRFLDTDRRCWLIVAGACGGLAVLMKIVGLYYLAPGLLFLAYHEQNGSAGATSPNARRSWTFLGFTLASVATFATLLVMLVRRFGGAMEVAQYVVPGMLLGTLLVWNEWCVGRGGFRLRMRRLTGLIGPFLVGFALPIGVFLVPYVAAGALGDLYHGLFVLPQKRFQFGTFPLPPLECLVFPAAAVALFFACRLLQPTWVNTLLMALFAAGLVNLAAAGLGYRLFWDAARSGLPLLVAAACRLLAVDARRRHLSSVRREEIFLVTAAAALVALLQFPFSSPIYFCFVAPLLIVAAHFVLAAWSKSRPALQTVWSLAFLAFAVRWMNAGDVHALGFHYEPQRAVAPLNLARGGLVVPDVEARQYERLVAEIERRTPPGALIFATPDCPEIYFLSGQRNPTRTLGEFFEDPLTRPARVAELLDRHPIAVVVVNAKQNHSGPLDEALTQVIVSRFPTITRIGRFYLATKDPQVAAAAESHR